MIRSWLSGKVEGGRSLTDDGAKMTYFSKLKAAAFLSMSKYEPLSLRQL